MGVSVGPCLSDRLLDHRNCKVSPEFSRFKNKTTTGSLWLYGWYKPSWTQGELLRRSALQQLQVNRTGEICVSKERMHNVPRHHKAPPQQQQEVLFQEDTAALVDLLKTCAKQKDLCKGSRVGAHIRKTGLLQTDIYVGTELVNMYAKCGALVEAQEVFDELPVRNVVSWNVLISGYAQHRHGYEALSCFERMQHQGLSPDAITFTCVLKACSSVAAAEKGEGVHAEVVREGLLEKNIYVGNALVDMYAKCGRLAKAQKVFDVLPAWDVVSWNALISGYTQHGDDREALKCFEWMQLQGPSPDAVTFTCMLKACGSIGAVEKGEEIHAEVVRQGLLQKNIFVGNALVDMYGKCGLLATAQEVFDELPVRDVVSWNALIAGYAQLGKVDYMVNSFNRMLREGVEPDAVTFIVLLNACSHSGLTEEGQLYFETMKTRYGIIPTLEHHICMVDLFGRAQLFEKAIEMIEKMPLSGSSDYLPLWATVLGACRKWGNVKLARLAFEHVIQLDEKDGGAYVCMRDVYAAASMSEEAEKVEAMRVKNKAQVFPGCYWCTV